MVEIASERKKHHMRGIAMARTRIMEMSKEERQKTDFRHIVPQSEEPADGEKTTKHNKDFGSDHVAK